MATLWQGIGVVVVASTVRLPVRHQEPADSGGRFVQRVEPPELFMGGRVIEPREDVGPSCEVQQADGWVRDWS